MTNGDKFRFWLAMTITLCAIASVIACANRVTTAVADDGIAQLLPYSCGQGRTLVVVPVRIKGGVRGEARLCAELSDMTIIKEHE